MPARVWFSPQARSQAREAALWWRANRPLAPRLFAKELRAFPNATIPALHRILRPGTKYHLYYVLTAPEVLEIVTVWSAVKGRQPPLTR
jgi:hypothetical protein